MSEKLKRISWEQFKKNCPYVENWGTQCAYFGTQDVAAKCKEPLCRLFDSLPDAPEKPSCERCKAMLEKVQTFHVKKEYATPNDKLTVPECPKVEWKTIRGIKRAYLGMLFLGDVEPLGNGNEFCHIMCLGVNEVFAGVEGTGTRKIEQYGHVLWNKIHGGAK